MIPRFSLVRPHTLDEALAAFEATGGDAAYLAGGTELLQVMKLGFAQIGTLIDVKRVPDLKGIERRPDGWLRLGAAVTHREIERSELVRHELPALAGLELHLANARVRNAGTIGGNLAFAEPHSDPATFLLACGATVLLASPSGRRELPIDEFVVGPLFTAREADEVMISVQVPPAAAGEGRSYDKLAFFERPAASVAVRLTVRDGAITAATVAVGSVGPAPTLVAGAAEALLGADAEGDGLEAAVTAASGALAHVEAEADLNGSADYKRHLAAVLLRRAVAAAIREAQADA